MIGIHDLNGKSLKECSQYFNQELDHLFDQGKLLTNFTLLVLKVSKVVDTTFSQTQNLEDLVGFLQMTSRINTIAKEQKIILRAQSKLNSKCLEVVQMLLNQNNGLIPVSNGTDERDQTIKTISSMQSINRLLYEKALSKWIDADPQNREYLIEHYMEEFLSFVLDTQLQLTESEIEKIRAFLDTEPGKDYCKTNKEGFVEMAQLRLLLSEQYHKEVATYLLNNDEEIVASDLHFLKQYCMTEEGNNWLYESGVQIWATPKLRFLAWEIINDPAVTLQQFIENEYAPTEEEIPKLKELILSELFTITELDDIKNDHFVSLVIETRPQILVNYFVRHPDEAPIEQENELMKGYFRSPAGRAAIAAAPEMHVNSQRIKNLIFKVYPPTAKENLDLYPCQYKVIGGCLFFLMAPDQALVDPDLILQAVVEAGEKGKYFNNISIEHYGSPGVDYSGLCKQLLSQLSQSLVRSSKIPFVKGAQGYLEPKNIGKAYSEESKKYFVALGKLLGFAFKWNYPIGRVFSNPFLKTIREGGTDYNRLEQVLYNVQLDFFEAYYNHGITKEELGTIEEKEVEELTDPFRLMAYIVRAKQEEKVLEVALRYNQYADEEHLQGAINNRNLDEIRKQVLKHWFEEHKYYFDAINEIVKGFGESLPMNILDIQINNFVDFIQITTKDFADQLQGRLSAEEIKEQLVIEGPHFLGNEEIEERIKWFEEWIDAHADDMEALANFVQGFTGGRALTNELIINLTEAVDGLSVHTCSNEADMPIVFTKEMLFFELNEFAAGRGTNFDQI